MKRVLLVVVAVLVVAGCGSGADEAGVVVTGTSGLEPLAAAAGCKPVVRAESRDLRQANCRSGKARYVLAAFRTDRGQSEWLDAANDYGGSYLVGRRWIAVGERSVLVELRGRLGGTVVTSSHHSGNSGGGGREEEHHAGHGTN
ncbi:hypothetical protein RCO28_02565 [Streptomyces sp. LHD-70]|uniref:hypothetical protein n=1 Tax=Streptomyces sp. LHD-70 TaxID=3072140 RepID=UPI00280E71A1|nr:hypothetical protein [Streptomyces sp. LHD-70]MDQ8701372.1 hypothetical protein [Streptomyces sp. LHD-70]